MTPANEMDDALRERGLPVPTAEERAHQARLISRIRDEIGCSAIPFSRFMELALYAPALGYYAAGKQKFGAEGDFVTAPELGPLFAGCLGNQCLQIFDALGHGEILEAGAGSGLLAAQLLEFLEHRNALPRRYAILELSAELRDRQRHTLASMVPHLLERVEWLDRLPAVPIQGIIIANELLDAMPAELFHHTADGDLRRHVAWSDAGFVFTDRPAEGELAQRIAALDLPPDYISEIGLAAEGWVRSMAASLEHGVALLIDYGFPRREYYHLQRTRGTLMCHYRHRAHDDPLILAGLQDITAHVDFTAVAEAAVEAGLEVAGYTSQAAFLLGCGLDQILTAAANGETRMQLLLANQAKRLTLPSEMGELFKVIALSKNVDMPLRGFALQDRRGAL
jgi:SAM-dependent MidA family methyltransferase